MIHDNKGFLNFPSKLPCYRNMFYISPVSSSTFLLFVITCVYTTKTNLLWITTSWTRLLCWWGGGPKRVHRWGWTSRKPSQQTESVVRWLGHAIGIQWKSSNGLFSLSTFYWWELGDLPCASSSLQKNFEVEKTRPSFPQTMRSVHMYVKLDSSWNILWPKLEWKVLWRLPLYFLSCKYSIFHFSHLYPPALSTSLSSLGSFNVNYITFRIIENFKTYLFKKRIMKENKSALICTRIFCFYLKCSK